MKKSEQVSDLIDKIIDYFKDEIGSFCSSCEFNFSCAECRSDMKKDLIEIISKFDD